MYAKVLSDMEEMEQALEQSGKVFCYAENYVYSAAVQRAAQLIRHKKSKLLFLKGEESLKGSQARASGEWKEYRRWIPDPCGCPSSVQSADAQADRS